MVVKLMASKKKAKTLFMTAAALVGFLIGGLSVPLSGSDEPQYEVIVQGRDMDEVFQAVHDVGGEVTAGPHTQQARGKILPASAQLYAARARTRFLVSQVRPPVGSGEPVR